MKKFVSIIFAAVLTAGVWAHEYEATVDGVTWYYNLISDGEGGYNAEITYSDKRFGSLMIPSTLGGYKVTTIGSSAFYDCSSLTSVTIPEGVTTIGASAFYGCRSLTSVTIPSSVTTIGYNAFGGCSSLTSVTIPEGVTTIGDEAFCWCSSLTSVTIPEGVTTIGYYAFYNCNSLTSITIPEGVTRIDSDAFYGCSLLTSVTIPSSVTSIGSYAFCYCSSLISITIPDGVTSIGVRAFWDCSSLTTITIPDSVTTIGWAAFHGTPFYNNQPDGLVILGNGYLYECKGTCPSSVTIPDGVTTIGDSAFSSCSSLTSVTIPGSVTTIGDEAFYSCISLSSISLPKSVTTIGYRAFDKTALYNNHPDGFVTFGSSCLYKYKGTCPSKVSIPDSVTTIGYSAFSGCSSLTSVTIPSSVTTIGDSAFSSCSSLTSVTIPSSVTTIGVCAFDECSSLTSVTIPNSVTTIGSRAFCGCSSLTSITIPNSVTSIGNYAFYNCNSLTSITIPNSVTSIGDYAFEDCSSLTSVTIPDSVTLIGSCAFYNCSSLTSVTIPNSVTSIEASTFSGCSSLTSISIPSSVTSIGDNAFGECGNLTITFEGDCPENYINSGVLDVKETIRKGSGYPTVEEALAELGYNFDSSWIGVVSLWENNNWFYSCEGYIYDSVNYRRLPHWVSIGGESGDFEEGEFEYWDGYGYFRVVTEQEIISNIYLRSKIFDSYITYWLSYSDSGYVCPEGTCPVLGDGIAIEGYSENQDAYLSPYSINGSGMRPVCTRRGRSYFKLPSRDELESNMWQYWGRSLSLIYEPFVFTCGDQRIAIAPEKQSYVASFNLQNGDAPIHQRVVSDIMDPVNEWVGIKLLSEEDVYDTCDEVLYWDGYGTLSHRHQGGWIFPAGYAFSGWKLISGDVFRCDDGSQFGAGVVLESVDGLFITSDSVFEAVYGPVSYGITYEGFPAFVWGYDLPTSYTYGQECQLPKIENPGADFDYQFGSIYFRFEGWTINGEKVEGIPIGTSGDVTVRFNGKELIDLGAEGADSPEEIEPGRYCKVFSYDRSVAWNGEPSTPKVSVTVDRGSGGLELVEGKDFTVEYADNDKVGTAKVIVHGKGDYIGTYIGEFTITKGAIAMDYDPEAAPNQFLWQWTGLDHFPSEGLTDEWKCDFDYDGTEKSVWIYTNDNADIVDIAITGVTNAVNAGVYTARALGTITRYATDEYYNYTYVTAIDSTMTMTIRQRDLSGFSPILSGDVFFYDGAVKCPSVVVTDEGLSVELVKNRDYTVAYANNQKVGEATVTISGCGNYTGTITRQFTILNRLESLPKPTISPTSKISSGRTTITIAYAGISGYATEVRYTTDGAEPTSASTKYDKRFSIDVTTDTKVRAAAFLRDVRVSEIAEARYLPSANAVIVKSGVGCGPVTIQVGGVAPWMMDVVELGYDGTPTMRSGKIGNDSSSEMTASFTGDGVFEFSWKTSCEHDEEQEFFYDHVECLLDGEVVAQADGETPWTKVVVPVATKGDHTIVWKYVKDDGDDAEYPGEDCVWVDGVKFTFAAYIDFAADEEIVGELPERIVSASGYSITLPEIGEVKYAKHVFSGWTYGGKVYQPGDLLVVDAQEMVVKPVWTEVLEVAYDLNGGSGNIPVTQRVISGGSVELFGIGESSLAKHAFGGWLLDGEIYSAESEYRPVGDVTFTAVWVAKTLKAPTIIVASEHDDPTTMVEITSGDYDAVIYYTIDGSEPNVSNGTRYEGSFEVAGSVTIKAIATKDDYFDSEVVEATVVSTYTPTTVAFDGGEGVVGTMPSAIDTALRREIVLPEIGNAHLPKHKFGGWTDGVNVYQPGDKYSIVDEICFSAVWTPKVLKAPVITVAEVYDGEKTSVVITTDDAEADIRYTLDGSDPNLEGGLRYESSFDVVGTTTIKAIVFRDDWFDSEIVEKTTVRSWGTLNACLDNERLVFTTGGDANWIGTSEEAYLGNTSVCSGFITHNQSSWLETKVEGAGVLTFAIKVESEYSENRGHVIIYDGLRNLVDSVAKELIGGNIEWTIKTLEIEGDGEHTIRWVYAKDDRDEEWCGRDRAWIDAIVWTPKSTRPDAVEGASEETKAAFDQWILAYKVENPSAANVNAFILGLEPSATEEAIQEKVEEELANLDLGKLVEGDISAAVAEIQAKYPNAKVDLAPVEDLNSSAHLYKLVIKLK